LLTIKTEKGGAIREVQKEVKFRTCRTKPFLRGGHTVARESHTKFKDISSTPSQGEFFFDKTEATQGGKKRKSYSKKKKWRFFLFEGPR